MLFASQQPCATQHTAAASHFNVVVIDEATQATEPATLVPLTQGATCAVMAGDPAQLPPTITSREALRCGDVAVVVASRPGTNGARVEHPACIPVGARGWHVSCFAGSTMCQRSWAE